MNQVLKLPFMVFDFGYVISSVRLKVIQIQLVREVSLFWKLRTACEGLR